MPDLTPQALHDLSLRVPVEARPEGLAFNGDWSIRLSHLVGCKFCGVHIDDAILMHEAAAMRWLVAIGWYPMVGKRRGGEWVVVDGSLQENHQTDFTGPTLYHALVAAIEGLEPKRGNCYIKYWSGTGPRG